MYFSSNVNIWLPLRLQSSKQGLKSLQILSSLRICEDIPMRYWASVWLKGLQNYPQEVKVRVPLKIALHIRGKTFLLHKNRLLDNFFEPSTLTSHSFTAHWVTRVYSISFEIPYNYWMVCIVNSVVALIRSDVYNQNTLIHVVHI